MTGLGIRAHFGERTNYLGAHPSNYGLDQVFILERGAGERLPWVYSADLRLGYSHHIDKDKSIQVTIDIFNILNFQTETARDQRYTSSAVQPVTNGGVGQLRMPMALHLAARSTPTSATRRPTNPRAASALVCGRPSEEPWGPPP